MRSTAYTVFILLLIAAASVLLAGGAAAMFFVDRLDDGCFQGECGHTAVFVAWPGLTIIFFAIGAWLFLRPSR